MIPLLDTTHDIPLAPPPACNTTHLDAQTPQPAAKQNAPWTDRTGNARSGLFGTAERDVAQRIVTIYLSHGATLDYGQYLELSNGGRYAVIMRTIEGHLPALNAMLRDVLG